MDWQGRFYPVDVFSGLLGRMDGLTAAGRLLAPALVREEIEKVGTMGLRTWAAANPALFISTGDVLQQAQVIQGQFPDLLDPRAEFEEADAYVIALGHACVMASWSHKRRPRPRSAALAGLTTFPTCAEIWAFRASTCSA